MSKRLRLLIFVVLLPQLALYTYFLIAYGRPAVGSTLMLAIPNCAASVAGFRVRWRRRA